LPKASASDNPLWDRQLRDIVAAWFAHAVRLGGKSEAQLAREAGVNTSTIQRLKKQTMTVSGAVIEALAEAAGVPPPSIVDVLDYGALYTGRFTSGPPTSAAAAEQLRRDALAREPDPPAAATPKKRARGGKR
jgi:transcriptional regulator with XRE-family HTH domain